MLPAAVLAEFMLCLLPGLQVLYGYVFFFKESIQAFENPPAVHLPRQTQDWPLSWIAFILGSPSPLFLKLLFGNLAERLCFKSTAAKEATG